MKIEDIHYVPVAQTSTVEKLYNLFRFLQLSAEVGASEEGSGIMSEVIADLDRHTDEFTDVVMKKIDDDPEEPGDYQDILAQRPDGPRRMLTEIPDDYMERLSGSFYARMAGCTLGAGLEYEPVDVMQHWAEQFGDSYPLRDYWSYTMKDPQGPHYIVGKNVDLTKGHMDAVPPDDDTIYTLLGLLLLEQYGIDFTPDNLAEIWKHYLPLGDDEDYGMRGCFWGERIMLKNLLKGVDIKEAGHTRNPMMENVAGWTRIDSYAYALPGWPEKAAELAYRDVSLNHCRNGIYGAMFMAAAISAAFAVNDPIEAVKIGLTEIPQNCLLSREINWVLQQSFNNWQDAYNIIWRRLGRMFNGSAVATAVQVVAGLMIGGKDITRVLGETVALGGDNDCTGATAGSIAGAVAGKRNVPSHWTDPFNGRMHVYLNDTPEYLEIDEVLARIKKVAEKSMSSD